MIRRRHPRVVPCLLLCFVAGCKSHETKDQERACYAALGRARVDVKDGLLDAARQKLRVAEESCPPRRAPYVDELRTEISRKAAQMAEQARQEATEAKRRREQPTIPFMEWVRKWSATGTDQGDVVCYERTDSRFGWCDAKQTAPEGVVFHARFQKAQRDAIRFSTSTPFPLVCDDVGDHRVVRTWQTRTDSGDTVRRTHCELAEKGHRGQSALVSVFPDHSEIDVFNRGYLDHDLEFAEMLRHEGR